MKQSPLAFLPRNEELYEFSAVDAGGPLFISSRVRRAPDTEFAQAIVATDDVVSIRITSRLNGMVVNIGGSRAERRFPDQVRHDLEELFRQEFILGAVSIRGQSC